MIDGLDLRCRSVLRYVASERPHSAAGAVSSQPYRPIMTYEKVPQQPAPGYGGQQAFQGHPPTGGYGGADKPSPSQAQKYPPPPPPPPQPAYPPPPPPAEPSGYGTSSPAAPAPWSYEQPDEPEKSAYPTGQSDQIYYYYYYYYTTTTTNYVRYCLAGPFL